MHLQPESSPPEIAGDAEPRDAAIQASKTASADAALVARCLAGDQAGWEMLYHHCHPRLVRAIKFLLGAAGADFQLVDEMAARVWFALVRDDAKLLARFDPQQHTQLDSFLAGVARVELLRYLRSERRRKTHEWEGGRRSLQQRQVADWQMMPVMRDFATTLTPIEREFLEGDLIALRGENEDEKGSDTLSPSNIWQRRHRIRVKLKEFMEG